MLLYYSRLRHAPVAQLDRVTDYESVGRGFESLPAYQRRIIRTLSQWEKGSDYFCFWEDITDKMISCEFNIEQPVSKLNITFNHKDGAQIITLSDIETALAEQENGSDLVSSAVPKVGNTMLCFPLLYFRRRDSNHKMQMSGGHLLGGGSTTPTP